MPGSTTGSNTGSDRSADSAVGSSAGTGRRGLRSDFAATRAAFFRLVAAHVELARTELEEILAEAKRVAALLAGAFFLVLMAALLFFVGSTLFVGEWLFGSMGWGILHGLELMLTVSLVLTLAAMGIPGGRMGRLLVPAIVVGGAVAILAGSGLPNRAWDQLGAEFTSRFAISMDEATRPLLVGVVTLGVMGGVLGIILGFAGGRGFGRRIRGGLRGLRSGAVLGGAIGVLSAITFGHSPHSPANWHVGIALGIAIGLAAWAVLVAMMAMRHGIDAEAFGRRFYPSATIDTTRETIEWVRERLPLKPKS